MKSRVILLAAMLFALPAFAGEPQTADSSVGTIGAPKTETGDKNTTPPATAPEASIFSKIRDYAAVPFVFVLATAPDFVAKQTLGRIAKIEYLKGGKVAAFLGNKWTGRAAVGLIAIAAVIKGYQFLATEADDVDAGDDEEIFPK